MGSEPELVIAVNDNLGLSAGWLRCEISQPTNLLLRLVDVPRNAYTVTEEEEKIHLCGLLCLCFWPDLLEVHRGIS